VAHLDRWNFSPFPIPVISDSPATTRRCKCTQKNCPLITDDNSDCSQIGKLSKDSTKAGSRQQKQKDVASFRQFTDSSKLRFNHRVSRRRIAGGARKKWHADGFDDAHQTRKRICQLSRNSLRFAAARTAQIQGKVTQNAHRGA